MCLFVSAVGYPHQERASNLLMQISRTCNLHVEYNAILTSFLFNI